MIKNILCDGRDEATEKLNELEKKGYNLVMCILGITQDRGYYTIFYKYSESLEKRQFNL